MSTQKLSVRDFKNLYFAYGSNLHLAQMAQRCPASVFVGKATLRHYKWQINKRGVANVVKSKDDYVEGLLFSIDEKDEQTLDRNEGVARRLYDKIVLTVDFQPGDRAGFMGRTTAEMAKMLDEEEDFDALPPTTVSENLTDQPRPKSQREQAHGANEELALMGPPQRGVKEFNRAQSNDRWGMFPKTTVSFDSTPVVEDYKEIDMYDGAPMERHTRTLSLDEDYSKMDQNPSQQSARTSSERSACDLRPRRSDGIPRSQSNSFEAIDALQASRQPEASGRRDVNESTPVDALVYVSQRFRKDGEIREEYVARIERAIADGLNLGMSKAFVDRYMEPFVHGPIMVPDSNKSTPRQAARGKRNEDKDITVHDGENESSGKGTATSRHDQDTHACKRSDRDKTRGHRRQERTLKRRSGSGTTNEHLQHGKHAKAGQKRSAPENTGGGSRTEDESDVLVWPFSWISRLITGEPSQSE